MKRVSKITKFLAIGGLVVGCSELKPMLQPVPVGRAPYLEGRWKGTGQTTVEAWHWSGPIEANLGHHKNYAVHGSLYTELPLDGKTRTGQQLGPTRHYVNAVGVSMLASPFGQFYFLSSVPFDQNAAGYLMSREPMTRSIPYGQGDTVERIFDLLLRTSDSGQLEVGLAQLGGESVGSFSLAHTSPDRGGGPGQPSGFLDPNELYSSYYHVDPRFRGTWIAGPLFLKVPIHLTLPGDDFKEMVDVYFLEIALELDHIGSQDPNHRGVVSGGGTFKVLAPRIVVEGGKFDVSDIKKFEDEDKVAELLADLVQGEGEIIVSGDVNSPSSMRCLFSVPISPEFLHRGRMRRPLITGKGWGHLNEDGNTMHMLMFAQSVEFTRIGEKPTPEIIQPADGATFAHGESILFEGNPRTGTMYRWVVGQSPFGDSIPAPGGGFEPRTRVTWDDFEPGEWKVAFEAWHPSGYVGSDTITIRVLGQPPYPPIITHPLANTTFEANRTITFKGAGWDPEEHESIYKMNKNLGGPELEWSIDGGPMAGVGTTWKNAFTQTGEVEITLLARDSEGQTASTSRKYTVAQTGGDPPPQVWFKTPNPAHWLGVAYVKRDVPFPMLVKVEDTFVDMPNLKLDWRVRQVLPEPVVEVASSWGPDVAWTYTWPASEATASGSAVIKDIRTYEVEVTVEDPGGQTGTAKLRVVVFPKEFTIE